MNCCPHCSVTKVTTKLLIRRRDLITTSYCSTQKESICCHVHVIQDQEKHQDGPPQEEVLCGAPAAWHVSWRGSCQVQHRKWLWDCQRMSSLDMSRLPDTHHIYVNVTCLIHQMLRKPHGLDEADTRERSPHSLLQSQKAIFSWLFLTASTIKTMWALGSHKPHDSSITCKNKSIIHQLMNAHDSGSSRSWELHCYTMLHHVTPTPRHNKKSKIESIGYVGGSTSQEQWFGRSEYEFLLATRVHPACACGIPSESQHRHR